MKKTIKTYIYKTKSILILGLICFLFANISKAQIDTISHQLTTQQQASFTDQLPSTIDSTLVLSHKIDSRIRAHFIWDIEDRYGLDVNNNQLIDLPNSYEYINPNLDNNGTPRFKVTFHLSFGNGYKAIKEDIDLAKSNASERKTEFENWKTQEGIELDRFQLIVSGERESGTINESNLDVKISKLLTEGWHKVTLNVFGRHNGRQVLNSYSEDVFVEDILIIGMGDSYSSGEGNPESIGTEGVKWADGMMSGEYNYSNRQSALNSNTTYKHHAGHRSTLSWSSQAALDIEKSSTHSSVTYALLAVSGATIKKGVLGVQTVKVNVPPPFEEPGELVVTGGSGSENTSHTFAFMPSQIDQLQEIVGNNRKIDLLPISIGGNDIGFSKIIAGLILRDYNNHYAVGNYGKIKKSIDTGKWDDWDNLLGNPLRWILSLISPGSIPYENVTGLINLKSDFTELKNELNDFEIGKVFLLEYPYVFTKRDNNNNITNCDDILTAIAPKLVDFEVDFEEQSWAKNNAFLPLNNTLKQVAGSYHNWHYISGASNIFEGHAMCGSLPYVPENYSGNLFPNSSIQLDVNSTYRWYRRYEESQKVQADKMGTAHPNEFGHQALKERFLAVATHHKRVDQLTLYKQETKKYFDAPIINMNNGSKSARECTNEYDLTIRQEEFYESDEPSVFSSIPPQSYKVSVKIDADYNGNSCNNCQEITITPGQEIIIEHVRIKREYDKINIHFLDKNNEEPKWSEGEDSFFNNPDYILYYDNKTRLTLRVETRLPNNSVLTSESYLSKERCPSKVIPPDRYVPIELPYKPLDILFDPIKDRLLFKDYANNQEFEINEIFESNGKLKPQFHALITDIKQLENSQVTLYRLKDKAVRREVGVKRRIVTKRQRNLRRSLSSRNRISEISSANWNIKQP